MLTFDARVLAAGWLAVAVASAADKGHPALHRTISIEEFPEGVRLVATDSHVLLTAWVPALDCELAPEPFLDDAPLFRAVAMDSHSRGRGFLEHVRKLAADAADDPKAPTLDVTLRLAATASELGEPDGPARTLDGFELRHVVLDLPGSERLKLVSYEGAYPNWRTVTAGFRARRTTHLGLNPEVVSRLAKAGRIFPGHHLGWTFGGIDKMAQVEVVGSFPHVHGVVMPVRWDFDRDEPRDDQQPRPPADSPDPEGPADLPTVADLTSAGFTSVEMAALRLLASDGELTAAVSTDAALGTIARDVARGFLTSGLIVRARFDDTLRPVYRLTDLGESVL